MFDYTFAAIDKTLSALKKIRTVFQCAFRVFTLSYLIYAIAAQKGNLIVNSVLLSLLVAYSIFEICSYNKIEKMKTARKQIRRLYVFGKLSVKAVSLGIILYGAYSANTNMNAFSVIVTTLMLISWIMQTFLELGYVLAERYLALIKKSFLTDVELLKDKFDPWNILHSNKDLPLDQKNLNALATDVEMRKKQRAQKFADKIKNTASRFTDAIQNGTDKITAKMQRQAAKSAEKKADKIRSKHNVSAQAFENGERTSHPESVNDDPPTV